MKRLFSMRSGGGRDVTLTLPDGRRTTFQFNLQPAHSGFTSYYQAVWTPPPGVHASLRTSDPDDSAVDVYGFPHWRKNPEIPMDNYDFSGFILTTADGTQYTINRQDLGPHIPDFGEDQTISGIGVHAYGPAYLSKITDRNSNTIEIANNGVQYRNPAGEVTKSITFQRDAQGRIDAIYDPNSSAGVPPVPCVVYSYDAAGNLTTVSNLVSRTGVSPVYTATTYLYENPHFPHFITEIRDPRGITPLRNLYDDSGRLYGVVDAFGKTNTFIHDLVNKTETVFDRLGNPTVHGYDNRGNITQTIQYLNGRQLITSRTYDADNNETSVTDPLGHTTSYTYDGNGNRTSVTDPNTNTTYFVYDSFGNILSTSNAVGVVIQNQYDAAGNLTVMANALGLAMTNLYDDAGHNIGTVDNTGSASFGYDGSGNITGSTGSDGVTHTLQYDANGNMTNTFYQWTNPNNSSDVRTLTSRTDYDASGRITKTVDADGNQMQTIYDELGKPAQTINALGGTNTFVYDAKDNVIEMDYPDGTITRTVYDANGRSVVTTDRYVSGNQVNGTQTIYDQAGRVVTTERLSNVVVSITSPGGVTQSTFASASSIISSNSMVYDDANRLIARTGPDGQTFHIEYDAAGRRTAVVDPLGKRTEYEYDAVGRCQLVRDALQHATQFGYDAAGHRVTTLFHDYTFTSNIFNKLGQKVAEIDQAGVTNSFQYDTFGRLSAVVKPLVFDPESNATVQATYGYTYDQYGKLSSITDPKGRVTFFTYDPQGRQLTRTLPMGQTETNTYNALGQLVQAADFKGQVKEFDYDSLGRVVTNKLYAAGSSSPSAIIGFRYDSLGRQTQIIEPRGTTTIAYDLDGHITQVASPEGTINYEYDTATGRRTRTYTTNSDVRYNYDELGRLKTVTVVKRNGQTVSPNEVATYAYTDVGTRQELDLPNGDKTTYGHDDLNRLTNLENRNAFNALLSSYQYTLHPTGRRTRALEMRREPSSIYSTNDVRWAYDNLYRLTNETINVTGSSLGETSGTISYTYDLVGNRLSRTSNVTGVPSATYSYDDNDRLTQEILGGNTSIYQYDANGSLTNKSTAGQNVASYAYNLENRLTGASVSRVENSQSISVSASYAYNRAGIRVSTIATRTMGGSAILSTNLFLVDQNNPTGYAQTLEELPSVGAIPTVSYTIGDDIISQATGGTVRHFMRDGHGSTRLLTDSNGAITDRYAYDAFGISVPSQQGVVSPPTTSQLYTGAQFDKDLQQYYLLARFDDPQTGRFNQMDSFAGNNFDPPSLHKYAYCRNDPVNRIDPSGQFDLVEMMVNVAIQDTIASFVMPRVMQYANPVGLFLPTSIKAKILELKPCGFIAGASGTGSVGKWGLELGGGGGVEGVYSFKTHNLPIYGFWELETGLGGQSYEVDINVYAGLVWNMENSSDYEGRNWFLAVPFKAVPSQLKSVMIERITETIASEEMLPLDSWWNAQGFNQWTFNRVKTGVADKVNRIGTNISFFMSGFDKNKPLGFSLGLSYELTGGDGNTWFTIGRQGYWQFYPGEMPM